MKKWGCLSGICVMLLYSLTTDAQAGLNAQKKSVSVKRANSTIKIDGILNEPDWQSAQRAGDFIQNFPTDTARATYQTEAKICFDSENLYFSAICFQPKQYTVQTLKRDFPANTSDLFAINIDPFGDQLNAFYFAVNPYGIQKEGQISNGNVLNTDWDNKWTSAVKNYDDKWVLEIAIPFKALRYKSKHGVSNWNINFVRNNVTRNEHSSWIQVKRNFRLTDLTFTGELIWLQQPPSPATDVSLIPYALSEVNKNFQANTPAKHKLNGGADAKIAVTPSLNLDLTINPDFAQVEVDRQVTDLSRFELYFPERRQFFIENSDLFANFGSENMNPFFSRRIGLNKNSLTGFNEKVPIIGGARLSGRINKDWRVGLMDMQTAALKSDSLPANNFLVAAVQRRFLKRSTISALLVNKNGFIDGNTKKGYSEYNRVAGTEIYYQSNDNKWQGRFFINRSFQPKFTSGQYSGGFGFLYSSPKKVITSSFFNIDKNYNAEVGYVPRKGIYNHYAQAFFYTYPKGNSRKWLNRWSFNPQYTVTYDKFVKLTSDWTATLNAKLFFQNSAELTVSLLNWDYTYLFNSFDPTNKYQMGYSILPAKSSYQYFSNKIGYKSDARKLFTYSIQTRAGSYFNGKLTSVQTSFAYRVQPYGIFSVDINYDRMRLPQGFNNANFWLLGPKAEISFTKKIFWTTFVQYNTQLNNFNVNSRFQWRYKPLSDLYLVYTDNYYAQDFEPGMIKSFTKKNRAFVLKLNYWFSL